ncbi:DUF4123 domain-containing protein [Lysobacter arvi]|uniref:DUF4123 domain-containing protein n=1 Tax=Lysobacter arvi TaxID=3038776 RepID=A0ABU1CE77_9GAMM|nr:DUF4123 domain-containing protein [Lysobacter arvi]MDR0183461.1 DUF4123 domain-containing protein [Lysobacter arvi]
MSTENEWAVPINTAITVAVLEGCPSTLLLLNTQALEDWAYPGLPSDAAQFPHAPSVTELVRQIDRTARCRWLWEGGRFHSQRERGPLLVEPGESSPLLAHFIEHWAPVNGGVLLGTEYPLEDVLGHLASLNTLTLPDSGPARFNWDATKLAGWLNALDADRHSDWMGPVTRMVWRANVGPAHTWYRADNAEPEAAPPQADGWFRASSHELEAFAANDLDRFLLSLAYEASVRPAWNQKLLAEAQTLAERIHRYAQAVNIRQEKDVRALFLLACDFAPRFDSPDVHRILGHTEESPQDRLRALARWLSDGGSTDKEES